jgi:predicted nucleotidyltransferase
MQNLQIPQNSQPIGKIVDWEALKETLAADPLVVAAWVFGSAQNGIIQERSDLDVGVLFTSKPSLDDLAILRANLQEALMIDDIDLVSLNRASSILRFEAVSGRLVFCRDRSKMAGFVSLAAREYEDDMAMAQRWLYQEKNV